MSVPAADRGATTVAERAVRRIAERAATEALPPGEVQAARGAAAVRGRRARVSVAVTLPYPTVLDDAGERVRSHVADRTAGLTGLVVPSARVR
ncbi:DEAD/DEAH box helicase, partial [Streptomyces sp. NPDC005904]